MTEKKYFFRDRKTGRLKTFEQLKEEAELKIKNGFVSNEDCLIDYMKNFEANYKRIMEQCKCCFVDKEKCEEVDDKHNE